MTKLKKNKNMKQGNTTPQGQEEYFLHFYEDKNFNKNRPTYCQEESDTYHHSKYSWCKLCDKILCWNCSQRHLLDNQLDHYPKNIFIDKEGLDFQFYSEVDKLNILQQQIDDFFNKEKNISQSYLSETLQKFNELTDQLIKIINIFKSAVSESVARIENTIKKLSPNNLREDMVRQTYNEIIVKLTKIEKCYTKNQNFTAPQIKSYHDELNDVFEGYKQMKKMVEDNQPKKKLSEELINEYHGIKKHLYEVIGDIKECTDKISKVVDNIKI